MALAVCSFDCASEVATVPSVATTSGVGGSGGSGETASVSSADAVSSTATGGVVVKPQACPPGTFATGFDKDGTMVCAAIEESALEAAETGCSLTFGWRDSCNNCMEGPAKWGRVNGAGCVLGEGGDDTCAQVSLGQDGVPLLGINTDGNVNGDDKFFVGLHCDTLGESASPGPCQPGEVAVGWNASGFFSCFPVARLATAYVRASCSVYLGWHDSCPNCSEPPSKWGHAEALSCANGVGDDGTCATSLLDGRWVTTFGLNTDGDVNGDDTFYAGIHCAPGDAALEHALGSCPSGKALVGIEADGSLVCESVAPALGALVRAHCGVTLGWRDTCNGCTEGPSAWGRASTEACTAGASANCVTATLGGVSVPLVAIGTGGDVNGDDTFYAGFGCH